jgi:NAD(P)-dependent dehydrogenase (short-subunit alcohol dehydrogenase family)
VQELEGKTAVITGGASGIGLGMARAFADAGMRLVLADVEVSALERATQELAKRAPEVIGVRTDVSEAASTEALAERAFSQLGAVHVLCNNAGVCLEVPIADGSDDDWRWLFSVNVEGVRNIVRAFVPRLRAQADASHLVNTASFNALIPTGFLGIYTATKFAVLGMSEALRQELAGDGIAVSTLIPLGVNTRLDESQRNRPGAQPINPQHMNASVEALRAGQDPDEVGRAVLEGIREERRFIFPSGAMLEVLRAQLDAYLEAMASAPA